MNSTQTQTRQEANEENLYIHLERLRNLNFDLNEDLK